ncbi:MAG TPA: WG repeat-containing protein, partial [Spirochaetota bacterium]|nr:WG repeat-containing protein [Spirochaetota bacterium]
IVIIQPQFDGAYDFHEGMARVGMGWKWGYIKNPLSAKEIVIHYEQAGAFVGTIYSIEGNEVIVAGNIAEKVRLFDTLCIFSGEKMVLLRAVFPMMTTSKCRVISGSIKDLQKGMKVYKYNKESKEDKK